MPEQIRKWLCFVLLCASLAGPGKVHAEARPETVTSKQPKLALLDFGIGIEITKLSTIQTVTEDPPSEQEAALVAEGLLAVRQGARWLLQERLASGRQFDLLPLEDVDAACRDLGLEPGKAPTREQLAAIRNRLAADLIVTGSVLDYGKVRWQWMVAGMTADMTWESMVIGVATAWNPIAMFANIGFELATSTPLWFGGGYLFGVAFRPVRVEAMAVETMEGIEVWSDMQVETLEQAQLQQYPEEQRAHKELQLWLNLARAMTALGDSLLREQITLGSLWAARLPD